MTVTRENDCWITPLEIQNIIIHGNPYIILYIFHIPQPAASARVKIFFLIKWLVCCEYFGENLLC